MENLFVELVVDESDGTKRHARPGETGHVVVTDLHNYGAPFIRYETGDIAIASDDAPCVCGRGLARIRAGSVHVADRTHPRASRFTRIAHAFAPTHVL
jgi:phenylacetate-CoA ligase